MWSDQHVVEKLPESPALNWLCTKDALPLGKPIGVSKEAQNHMPLSSFPMLGNYSVRKIEVLPVLGPIESKALKAFSGSCPPVADRSPYWKATKRGLYSSFLVRIAELMKTITQTHNCVKHELQ
jgi:hypothetical protein